MKKLFAMGAPGLTLRLLTISFAETYAFGVKIPVVRTEVIKEVRGGNVEKDFISFYTTPKTGDTTASSLTANQKQQDEDTYFVFGVRIQRTLDS
jgi:hypothetical protein